MTLSLFVGEILDETASENSKQLLREKCVEYMDRAEILNKYLNANGTRRRSI